MFQAVSILGVLRFDNRSYQTILIDSLSITIRLLLMLFDATFISLIIKQPKL